MVSAFTEAGAIWKSTGLEQGWQFLLVVVGKVSIGGHQI